MEKTLNTYFSEITAAAQQIKFTDSKGQEMGIEEACSRIFEKLEELKLAGKVLHLIGNGASASIASHFGLDYLKAGGLKTNTFNDLSALTAYANDLTFDEVFAFPIARLVEERDLLIAVSSSGNSPNIVRGLEAAKNKGAFVISVSGMTESNKIRGMGDMNMYFPMYEYGPIECAHTIFLHYILDTFVARSSD